MEISEKVSLDSSFFVVTKQPVQSFNLSNRLTILIRISLFLSGEKSPLIKGKYYIVQNGMFPHLWTTIIP
jgi:hypothetical protein